MRSQLVGCARQQDAGDMNESAEGILNSSSSSSSSSIGTCPVCARRLSSLTDDAPQSEAAARAGKCNTETET